MQLSTIIKRLKDNGIFDAIIEGKPLEKRQIIEPKSEWSPWSGGVSGLFCDNVYEIRIKPQPREWWIRLCAHHGSSVYCVQPSTINNCCEIVHVVEDFK